MRGERAVGVFDPAPLTGHNPVVLRVALGAIVLTAGLFAASVQMPSVPLATGDGARTATAAHDLGPSPDGDGGGEWSPRRGVAASTGQSAWTIRGLDATAVAMPGRPPVAAIAATAPSRSRAPAVPAHLLHIPLLI